MRRTTLATLLATLSFSTQVWALDLKQVYQEALANDAAFASARANLIAGQEQVAQGRSQLLPTLGATGQRVWSDTSATPGSDYRASTTYGLQLNQPLFRWANWQSYAQSKLAVAVSEAQFAQARQDLVLRVAQAYFDVLAAQDSLSFARAQKTAVSEQLAAARRNFEVGTATITDSHEAQARFDLATAQELAAEGDLAVRRAALEQIIGKPPAELARFKDAVELPAPEPAVIDEWVNRAVDQNYTVAQAELGLEIAKREIQRQRAGHLPTVDLSGSIGRSNGSSTTLPTTGWNTSKSYGVQLNVPLFAGGLVQSQVREAIALRDKSESDLENARRTAAQGTRQAFVGVTSGMAQVKALEAARVSSQSALESNKLGYQVGVRINIDVLNAQQQLFQTQRDLAKARYDTVMSGLRLKSAAATLGEADVDAINRLLVTP